MPGAHHTRKGRPAIGLAIALLLGPAARLGAQQPVGSEFRVNSSSWPGPTTTSKSDTDGSARTAPLAPVQTASQSPTKDGTEVAADAKGGFVVVWRSHSVRRDRAPV
jgi:hypothetical protein